MSQPKVINFTPDILIKKAKKLPHSPGVYFFLDQNKNILYIGKATSLRSRVMSYFNNDISDTRSPKIAKMMELASDLDYKETGSVLEALILENILIKKNNPVYNTKDKDGKSYQCLIITKESFPRVLIMRVRDYEKRFLTNIQSTNTKSDYVQKFYGPFSSGSNLKEAVNIIRKVFPFRDKCDINQGKPCFNYQIGLCPGICINKISPTQYQENIKYIKMIFEGKQKFLINHLKKKMSFLVSEQKFEEAIKYRNIIFSMTHIKDTALIKNDDINVWRNDIKNKVFRVESYDVAHISGVNRVGVMCVLEECVPNKKEYRTFKLIDNINDDYQGLSEILERRIQHKEWTYPDLVVIDGGEGHKKIAEHIINEKYKLNINICAVVKNDKHKPVQIISNNEAFVTRDLLSNTKGVDKDNVKKCILLANSEAHRFAIKYHKKLRDSIK